MNRKDRVPSGAKSSTTYTLVTGAAYRTSKRSHQTSEDARSYNGQGEETKLTMIHLSDSQVPAVVGFGPLS